MEHVEGGMGPLIPDGPSPFASLLSAEVPTTGLDSTVLRLLSTLPST